MTVSATPQLHPLGIGKLLDQAIRLYRRNFLKFIGIIAIVQIPIVILQLVASLLAFGDTFQQLDQFSQRPPTDPFELMGPSYFAGIGVSVVLALIGFFLVQGVATAALTRAVAGNYLGEPVGVIDSYQKIGRSWLTLIGALLLAILLYLALMIWWLVPCIGWVTGIGILLFFWLVVLALIAPIVVLEKQSASGAIRRAWDLARRRFWWVIGFMLILSIFGQFVISGPVALANFAFQLTIGDMFTPSGSQLIMQTVVQSLVTLVFSLLYLPLQLTATTLMYFDLRIRTEAFDLTLLAGSVSDEAVDVDEVLAEAPEAESGGFITWAELGNFALLSVGVLILYIILATILAAFGFAFLAAAGPGF